MLQASRLNENRYPEKNRDQLFFQPDGINMKLFPSLTYLLFLLLPLFFSCYTSKPISYFKDIKRDTVISNTTFNGAELKIKKTDILNISISSLSKEEDALFSKQETAGNTAGGPVAAGFPVDVNGNIH